MKLPHYVLLAGLLVIFLSCSAQSNDISKSDIYFSKALNLFEDSKFSKAKSYFQNIIDQFSGTEIAVDAKYYLAYCEYELNDFQNSKQSFMIYKRYSQDILKIQSARYMICMCMFNLTLDHSKDQSDTYYALEEFQTFIEDYPNSKYQSEVSDKINQLRNKLAQKKINTAKLYLKTEKYDSAEIYLNQIFGEYYDTEFSDDARILKVILFLFRGKNELAEQYLEENKTKFKNQEKFRDALNIISNTSRRFKIKNIYFLDYVNNLL